MKAYGGMDVQIHIFLTSALVGGQLHAPATHWIGGWVGPRASLGDVEKILDLTGTRTPVASYYADSITCNMKTKIILWTPRCKG
jgi:hypothetical protein